MKTLAAITRIAAATLAASLVLTGCSGSKDEPVKAKESNDKTSSRVDVPSGDNGDIKDAKGAISALRGFECSDDAGVWSAHGTLNNSSDEDGKYLVTVAVIDSKTSSVQGMESSTLAVKAGDKTTVEFDGFYKGKSKKGLDCVPRVVVGS
jgi:hypothetical protein